MIVQKKSNEKEAFYTESPITAGINVNSGHIERPYILQNNNKYMGTEVQESI